MFRDLTRRVLRLSASKRAPAWLFAVAVAEACIFPIPPDALLIPLCLARPERAIRLALLCTLGSVLGALLGYAIGALLFDPVALPIFRFYGYEAALHRFLDLYARYGFWVILVKGLTPIPFKIVTIASGAAQYPLLPFVLACLITRGARFLAIAAALRAFGDRAALFLERRLGLVTLAALVLAAAGIAALRFL
jgi:membrane protein YqaA with SNARE-associated domain